MKPPGNRSVLAQFPLHQAATRADRLRAAPMLFFESILHEGRAKGFWRFVGVGLVERAELVTQVDRHGRLFVNYVFDCLLVDLSAESLGIAWECGQMVAILETEHGSDLASRRATSMLSSMSAPSRTAHRGPQAGS